MGFACKQAAAAGVAQQDAALPGLKPGSIYMDSSTVSPDLARKIAAACAEKGVRFLDAPVTGGETEAPKRRTGLHDWGDPETLKAVEPIIGVLGKKWFLLGPNGAGQTIKLAMNSIPAPWRGSVGRSAGAGHRSGPRKKV